MKVEEESCRMQRSITEEGEAEMKVWGGEKEVKSLV